MDINPMEMLRLRERINQFHADHPRMEGFLRAVSETALKEGTVLEIRTVDPEGHELVTNIRLNANDIETLQMLHTLR